MGSILTSPGGSHIMKKKAIIAGISALVLIAIIVIIIIALKGRMTASTMRINEIVGSVILTDDSGKEQTPNAGRRLQDGNILDTKEDAQAVVELDDDRIVYMLELSRARFNKSGRAMKLTMEEGSTFFYIAAKLAEDESFEIETSTMVIGIRGTSGYVTASEDGPESVTITSGTVSVYCSKTGEDFEVHAGQKLAVVQMDGEWIAGFQDIDAWGIPNEVKEIILDDGDLLDEVLTATGWDEEDLDESAGDASDDAVSDAGSSELGGLKIEEHNFPDATFRDFLSTVYDVDGDGFLSLDEMYSVDRICFRSGDTNVYLPSDYYGNVSSLKGIEFFPNLRELYLEHQDLTELDLSNNLELVSLEVYDTGITYLDISYNTALLDAINNGNISAISTPNAVGGTTIMYSDSEDGRLFLSYDEGVELNTGGVTLTPEVVPLQF